MPFNSPGRPRSFRSHAVSMRQSTLLLSPVKHKGRGCQSSRNSSEIRLLCSRSRRPRACRTGKKSEREEWDGKDFTRGQTNNTYTPRRLGLLPVYLGEHLLQRRLELLVLRPLVEFADEVAPCLERIRGKSEGCVAEVLFGGFTSAVMSWASRKMSLGVEDRSCLSPCCRRGP